MEQNNNISPKTTSLEEQHPVVEVTDTAAGLAQAVELLKAGHGPLARDAERASGYRYSQRPYLIQIFRRGSGTILLDPPALGDLSIFTELFASEPWILHAADQDLPNLREHGMNPGALFDTELAARLLGVERFGLAALLEQFLGIQLAKKFSAVDWSTRPLPDEWLVYAALDVEYLVDLADILRQQLLDTDRIDYATAEFSHLLNKAPKAGHSEPWRRLSGIHQLKTAEQLEIARQLWIARDTLAQETDTAPGRLIPDRAIVAVAYRQPKTFPELMQLKEFTGKASRTAASQWWAALQLAQKSKHKPELRPPSTQIPPVKSWERHYPEAKQRYDQAREVIMELADRLVIGHDLLLTPEFLRILAFDPPETLTIESIADALASLGARDWQLSYTAPIIYQAFVDSLQS